MYWGTNNVAWYRLLPCYIFLFVTCLEQYAALSIFFWELKIKLYLCRHPIVRLHRAQDGRRLAKFNVEGVHHLEFFKIIQAVQKRPLNSKATEWVKTICFFFFNWTWLRSLLDSNKSVQNCAINRSLLDIVDISGLIDSGKHQGLRLLISYRLMLLGLLRMSWLSQSSKHTVINMEIFGEFREHHLVHLGGIVDCSWQLFLLFLLLLSVVVLLTSRCSCSTSRRHILSFLFLIRVLHFNFQL